MYKLLRPTAIYLAVSGYASAISQPGHRAACENKVAHKPWGNLTSEEQQSYINAELCLMSAPPQLSIPGAENRWDELHWNHIVQANYIHDVGAFLPWHRYFLAIHGNLLRDECDYTGPLPYWDETADADLAVLTDADVFQPENFGGDGEAGDSAQRCITDGPFVNTTLHLNKLGQPPGEYCIFRNLSLAALNGTKPEALDACFDIQTHADDLDCWFFGPHRAGHEAVGGLLVDVMRSPGDPMFYLHHGWLDVVWWKWQTVDLPSRLTDMGGRNIPSADFLARQNFTSPGPEFTDYSGDPGNVTTLGHVLWASGIKPNVTVADVMDVGGDVVCAEYFFSDSLADVPNS